MNTPTDLIKDVSSKCDDDLSIPHCDTDILVLTDSLPEDTEAPKVYSETPKDGAHCIAMMGATGGVGVTSLCIQIAHDLAAKSQAKLTRSARAKEPRICLIDLDFEGGACAHHLDLIPSLSMTDLTQSSNHIDRAYMSALITTHSSGFDLLATPNTLGGNDMANPQIVVQMLDVICQLYDHVIIDIPRYWKSWNMAAIGGADKFAIVTDLTIPSLHQARIRMKSIESILGDDIGSEIILNKYERRSFRNALREKDAETALKRNICATICADHDTLREAINCGEAAGAIRPESRYVKDVKALQEFLYNQHETTERSAA